MTAKPSVVNIPSRRCRLSKATHAPYSVGLTRPMHRCLTNIAAMCACIHAFIACAYHRLCVGCNANHCRNAVKVLGWITTVHCQAAACKASVCYTCYTFSAFPLTRICVCARVTVQKGKGVTRVTPVIRRCFHCGLWKCRQGRAGALPCPGAPSRRLKK
jgi:hypothetical protein